MSRPKRKHKKSGHGGPPSAAAGQESILAELEQRAAELSTAADDLNPGPIWGAIHKLLLKTSVETNDAARVIATRDPAALANVIRGLRGEDVAPVPSPDDNDDEDAVEIPADTLKKAMRAFRNRMKLTQLDHESKLGVGPMTGGKKAEFDGILPPNEYPRAVWDALAADGKLRNLGQGFYMLPKGENG